MLFFYSAFPGAQVIMIPKIEKQENLQISKAGNSIKRTAAEVIKSKNIIIEMTNYWKGTGIRVLKQAMYCC